MKGDEKNISVRVANFQDLDRIIFLGRTTFVETYKGTGDRPEGLEEVYGRETFNADKLTPLFSGTDSNKPVFLIGEVGGMAAGFAELECRVSPALGSVSGT